MPIIYIAIGCILLVIAGILVAFLLFNSVGFFAGAPFAPTPGSVIEKVFDLVPISEKDIVYDLGSGDGRVLIAAARHGAKAVGWEINYPLYTYAQRNIKRTKVQHLITNKFGNFWNHKFSGATVIFAFILPQYMEKLEQKIRYEAPPGIKVVTYLSHLPHSKPVLSQDGINVYHL